MRKKYLSLIRQIEWPLFLASGLCSFLGLWLIGMAASGESRERYLVVQAAAAAIGMLAFIVISFFDGERFFANWKLAFALELGLIALLIPFGMGLEQTGNRSWIRFTVLGLSTGFQPGEIAKALYILALAGHASRLELSSRARDVFGFALHGAIVPVFLLIVSKDYGTVLSFAAIFLIMALLGGVKLRYFIASGAGVALLFPYIWNSLLLDRQRDRLTIIFDTASDPLGTGYQTIRSVSAISAGGLLGSAERLTDLPARHTDFIFTVAGERFGFAGGVVIILLLTGFILRALYGFVSVRSKRGKMVCAGVAAALIFQVFSNIGMCLGVSPVIGITLPFFSYGGTSAALSYALMGFIAMYNGRGGDRLRV